MRFGAYGPDVQERLHWMRNKLAPVLKAALATIENGIDPYGNYGSEAITMGMNSTNVILQLLTIVAELAPILSYIGFRCG